MPNYRSCAMPYVSPRKDDITLAMPYNHSIKFVRWKRTNLEAILSPFMSCFIATSTHILQKVVSWPSSFSHASHENAPIRDNTSSAFRREISSRRNVIGRIRARLGAPKHQTRELLRYDRDPHRVELSSLDEQLIKVTLMCANRLSRQMGNQAHQIIS